MKTRILRIHVRNLASLEGNHTLELEHGPLADAGIFPIVGPTGAGKSTLLDAICLALFARLPRLPATTKGAKDDEGLSPSDPRHALRRGAGYGLAEVDFLGRDGRRYRATWSVQRARKRADGALQHAKHHLLDVKRASLVGDGKRETQSVIEDRLGLGYEELVRSMLLPQGEFAALLRSKPDERAKLLEKLTRTAIYAQISEHAGARRSEARRTVEQLDARLGEVRALAPEARIELEARRTDTGVVLAELRTLAEASRDAERWLAELHRHESKLAEAETELDEAQRATEAQAPLRAELELAERCEPMRAAYQVRAASHALAAQSEERRVTAEATLDASRAEVASATEEAEATSQALQTAKDHREGLREALARAKRLDEELRGGERELARLAEELETASQRRTTIDAALRAATEVCDAQAVRLAELDELLADDVVDDGFATQWPAIEASFRAWSDARQDVVARKQTLARDDAELAERKAFRRTDETELARVKALGESARQKLDTIVHEVDALEQAWSEQARDRLRSHRDSLLRLNEAVSTLERLHREHGTRVVECAEKAEAIARAERDRADAATDLAVSEQEHAEAAGALAEAERANLAHTLRAQLHPGEPCPVCGGTVNTGMVGPSPDLDRLRGALEALVKKVARARSHLATCDREYATAGAEHAAVARAKDDAAEPLAAQRARVEALRTSSALAPTAPVKDALVNAERSIAECATALQRLPALRKDRARWSAELARAVDTTQTTEERCREHDRGIERLEGRTESLRAALGEVEGTELERRSSLERQLGRTVHEGLEVELAAAVRSRLERLDQRRQLADGLVEREVAVAHERQRLDEALERETQRAVGHEREGANHVKRRAERALLLDGRPTDEVEAERAGAIDDAAKAHERASRRSAAAKARHAATREALVARRSEACEARDAAEEEDERWTRSLGASGLDAALVVETLAAWPPDRVSSVRAELHRIRKRLELATALREQASQFVVEHRESSPDDVVELAERRAYCDEAVARAVEVHARHARALEEDETRRRRCTALEHERSLATARLTIFEQLVSLVGSGQGGSNHLSRFAQGLTLEVLVDAANAQLARLAPRFGLRRVATSDLDIELVDHDLADETRPVHGLSGGETFLVSLALALGLATLASDDIDLGSLFVDEGFGSLDPDTLETALAALEAIHAEGVQVALITHVEGLADRFAASVHIRRVGPGRSVVEVRS